jgi:hypothetical protein
MTLSSNPIQQKENTERIIQLINGQMSRSQKYKWPINTKKCSVSLTIKEMQ